MLATVLSHRDVVSLRVYILTWREAWRYIHWKTERDIKESIFNLNIAKNLIYSEQRESSVLSDVKINHFHREVSTKDINDFYFV